MQRVIYILFLVGCALCLLQVWLPGYYLTGDGPCHVYNAKVLHDLWNFDKASDMYHHFYSVVYRPDPNWLSTFLLAALMYAVNGIIAEKVLLTFYVLLFVSGATALLKKISPGRSYWMLSVFILVFPHELSKGFYNSTLGIAFCLWGVWGWLRFMERKSIVAGLVFILLTALTYFTHLLAFGFEAFTCAALATSYGIATAANARFKNVCVQLALLAAFLSPFFILMVAFTTGEGGLQLSLTHHFYRLVELAQFKFMVNMTTRENIPALIAGICLLVLTGLAFLKLRHRKRILQYDGFILALLFALVVYVCVPESFMGRLILINMRVQPIVAALMVCCVAYLLPDTKVKAAGGIVLFACFCTLTVLRIACLTSASKAVDDYLSAGKFIRTHAVVLPLDFAPMGVDEHGKTIADWNFLFSHTADYLGLEKPLILLDNYEANMGYFPVRWNNEVNPYFHLDKHEGIEGVPPAAGIAEYKRATGVNIDYILMWCYNTSFLSNEHFRKLYDEINTGYQIVYTSPSGRTILYEANLR